jgi:hypothetical protein
MKVHMSFSIELALAKILNEESNKSEIINNCLRFYYSEKSIKENSIKTAEQEAEEILQ